MRLRHYLNLFPLLLLVPAGAAGASLAGGEQQTSSIVPAKIGESRGYRCHVEQVLKGGSTSLTRLFTGDGVTDGGDFMQWYPSGHDPQRTRRPLDIELIYTWNQASQPAVEPRKIEVQLRIGIDADLPEVAWIQMQRPFPIEPYGVIGSTALSTEVFPYSEHDMRNGHGELPLGDLLAYAEGYDALDWTLVRPSDRLGASQELTRGTIDIAALREAAAALPELRAALAVKTAKPQACDRILSPPPPDAP